MARKTTTARKTPEEPILLIDTPVEDTRPVIIEPLEETAPAIDERPQKKLNILKIDSQDPTKYIRG